MSFLLCLLHSVFVQLPAQPLHSSSDFTYSPSGICLGSRRTGSLIAILLGLRVVYLPDCSVSVAVINPLRSHMSKDNDSSVNCPLLFKNAIIINIPFFSAVRSYRTG